MFAQLKQQINNLAAQLPTLAGSDRESTERALQTLQQQLIDAEQHHLAEIQKRQQAEAEQRYRERLAAQATHQGQAAQICDRINALSAELAECFEALKAVEGEALGAATRYHHAPTVRLEWVYRADLLPIALESSGSILLIDRRQSRGFAVSRKFPGKIKQILGS